MRLEISICIVECGLSHHLLEWIFFVFVIGQK